MNLNWQCLKMSLSMYTKWHRSWYNMKVTNIIHEPGKVQFTTCVKLQASIFCISGTQFCFNLVSMATYVLYLSNRAGNRAAETGDWWPDKQHSCQRYRISTVMEEEWPLCITFHLKLSIFPSCLHFFRQHRAIPPLSTFRLCDLPCTCRT